MHQVSGANSAGSRRRLPREVRDIPAAHLIANLFCRRSELLHAGGNLLVIRHGHDSADAGQ